MRRSCLAILILGMLLLGGLSVPTQGSASTVTVDILAQIDGRDQMIIQGNTLQWHHFDYDLPGKWNADYPTYVSTKLDGTTVLNNTAWYPTWSGYPYSDVFTGLTPTVPATTNVTLTPVQARSSLTMVQMPDAGNGYTTVIQFDDNGPGGAAWYEAKLDYQTVPEPSILLCLGSGLICLVRIRKKLTK
jgi:hypothetical protein